MMYLLARTQPENFLEKRMCLLPCEYVPCKLFRNYYWFSLHCSISYSWQIWSFLLESWFNGKISLYDLYHFLLLTFVYRSNILGINIHTVSPGMITHSLPVISKIQLQHVSLIFLWHWFFTTTEVDAHFLYHLSDKYLGSQCHLIQEEGLGRILSQS